MAVGVNVHRFDGQVEAALMQLRPPVLVVSDPDWGVLQRCRAAFPTCVIYRYMTPGNWDNAGQDPEALAAATLAAIAGQRGLVDAVQAYNEIITSSNVAEQADRELRYVRAMQAQGVPVVALNAGVGNIEGDQVALLGDLWREAAAIGYHGYCRPDATDLDPPDTPWFLRRPASLWLPGLQAQGRDLGKLLLTETGTYAAPFPGMSPEAYADLVIAIHEYALQAGMLGTCVFTLSGNEPWRTQQPWELVGTGALDKLAAYNQNHPSAPPHLVIPSAAPRVHPAPSPASAGERRAMPERPAMVSVPSPNFGYPTGTPGRGSEQVVAIVDHIAGGSLAGLDAWFQNPASQVSAHYGVMRDGTIHEYVPAENASWNAGGLNQPDTGLPWLPPAGPAQGRLVNQRVIGIEHEGQTGETFTPEQVQATIALHRWLVASYNIPVDRDHIIGHYRLDRVNRANCPGTAFPWDALFAALAGSEADVNKEAISAMLDVIWGIGNEVGGLSDAKAPSWKKQLQDAAVIIKREVGLE